MMGTHYFIEQVVRTRHAELLKEVQELRSADTARKAARRHALEISCAAERAPAKPFVLAVAAGRALVTMGYRLQGTAQRAAEAVEARRCDICGEPFHGHGPIGSV